LVKISFKGRFEEYRKGVAIKVFGGLQKAFQKPRKA
jgi:hypothetical protein